MEIFGVDFLLMQTFSLRLLVVVRYRRSHIRKSNSLLLEMDPAQKNHGINRQIRIYAHLLRAKRSAMLKVFVLEYFLLKKYCNSPPIPPIAVDHFYTWDLSVPTLSLMSDSLAFLI
jgi:hypothetical protein